MNDDLDTPVELFEGLLGAGFTDDQAAYIASEVYQPLYLIIKERVPERWRAEKGEIFFYIEYGGVYSEPDFYINNHNRRYETCNYFRSKRQAQEAASRIKSTLSDYHKEVLGDE